MEKEQRAGGSVGGANEANAGDARPRPGPAAWPLHPVLFAAASVLALYTSNLRETSFADVAASLVTVITVAALIFVVIGGLLRSFGQRAAILASILVVGVLYHTSLFDRVNGLIGGILPVAAAVPLGLAAMVLLAFLVLRARVDLTLPNAILNGIALVLVATPLWRAASYTVETMALPREQPAAAAPARTARLSLTDAAVAAPAAGPMPDIYYFIFDRYGSEQTLARVYGYDNRPFLDSLRARGFYVAPDSHSNYPKTAPSLASTFHMGYLDFLKDDPLAKRNEWHPIYEMLDNHRVGGFLKSKGYRFIQIGSWWAPTQRSIVADENLNFGFSEFAWLYLRRTILPKVLNVVAPGLGVTRMTAWENGQCRRVPMQFEAVEEVSRRPEATFTFVHVLLPHIPYVFTADGRCLSPDAIRARGDKEGYIAQLRYANRLMDQMLDTLLASDEKPVIILQADEGPYPETYEFGDRSWHKASPQELATKTGILNAYFFPDGDYSMLYPDITPVNSFRLLFDKYFGTAYGPLPDRIFAFPDYSHIYDFFEVTDAARKGDRGTAVGNRQ